MYALLSFMEAVLREQRQLMKWVAMFQVRIFWVTIFRVGFPGKSLIGRNFPRGIFVEPFFIKRTKLQSTFLNNDNTYVKARTFKVTATGLEPRTT